MRNIKRIFVFTFIWISAISVYGQSTAASKSKMDSIYSEIMSNLPIILISIVMLIGFVVIYKLLSAMIRMEELKIYEKHGISAFVDTKKESSFWKRLDSKLTDAIPLEKEKDIMLDHDYDGIRELDNKLPPWWVWLFKLTIFIGVVYMGYYHMSGNEWSSDREWEEEMAAAKIEVDAYLATKKDLITEKDVTELTGEKDLAIGKKIYDQNCLACHGDKGQGGIGPNMTDEFWIHGGSVKDIFKTIKYGVLEKGMIAWKSQLKPKKMQQVTSYIMTMQGTNPPNAKAAEGEKYVPE